MEQKSISKCDRLKELIRLYADGSQSELARILGMTQGGVASWLKRDTFDSDLLLEKFPDLSAEWLMRGEGSMIKQAGLTNNITIAGDHSVAGSNNHANIETESGTIEALRSTIVTLNATIERQQATIDNLVNKL